VGEVSPDSPADKAGLKDGDIITEFNGKKVTDSRHLKLQVARIQPGETVPLKVLRDGSTKTLEAVVKEIPGSERLAKNDSSGAAEDSGTLNGVTVGDIDRRSRREFNIPENVQGVVITDVTPDSAAAEAGLKPGDVIQEINRKPVKSAQEAVQMTEKTEDKTTLLHIWSNGRSHYVVVDENEKKG